MLVVDFFLERGHILLRLFREKKIHPRLFAYSITDWRVFLIPITLP